MNVEDALAFLTVARLKSFSSAARQLHVAQSALSRRVQRLEQTTGHPLLQRHARGVEVTYVGRLLVQKVESLQAQIEQIHREMRDLRVESCDSLRLAIPHGAMRLFGPPLVERIKSQNPGVELHVFERESAHNRDSVVAGEMDFGLAYNPEPSPDLEITPLLIERLYVVGPAMRAGEPVHYPKKFKPAEVARLPLVIPGRNHGYRKSLERGLRRTGLRPHIALEVHGLSAVASFVQEGAGFALTTYAAMQPAIDEGVLVAVPIGSSRFDVTLCMLQRRSRELEPHRDLLRGAILETLASVEIIPPRHRRA